MGWMETCAVDERMRFVMAVESQEEPFAVVCRRFGVSRKTGTSGWRGMRRMASMVCSINRGHPTIIRRR